MKKTDFEREMVAIVANGLSDAQRRALMWLPDDGSERQVDKTPRLEPSLCALTRRRVMTDVVADLAECHHSGRMVNGRWVPNNWCITSLGKKVREFIELPAASDARRMEG